MKPSLLRAGDRVAVVAPAGPFDRPSFDAGLKILAERYEPVFTDALFTQERYLAGSDDRRFEELQSALDDISIKAIFAARGGYGSLRLLPKLTMPRAVTKLLVGFSDVTALHAWFQREGRVSVHAPVLTQLGKQPPDVVQRLFSLLEMTAPPAPLNGTRTVVPGVVEGRLIGGNLATLCSLLGTAFVPPWDATVLLLEDVGERPYRLDRLWTQLTLNGVFSRVRGIALGDFTACEEKDGGYGSAEVLESLALSTGLPCVSGLAVGHGEVNNPVPLGTRVRLDASAATLTFLEGACQ